jgi:hypothetical protein
MTRDSLLLLHAKFDPGIVVIALAVHCDDGSLFDGG